MTQSIHSHLAVVICIAVIDFQKKFNRLKNTTDSIQSLLCMLLGVGDQVNLYKKYNISPRDSVPAINGKVWKAFESELSF